MNEVVNQAHQLSEFLYEFYFTQEVPMFKHIECFEWNRQHQYNAKYGTYGFFIGGTDKQDRGCIYHGEICIPNQKQSFQSSVELQQTCVGKFKNTVNSIKTHVDSRMTAVTLMSNQILLFKTTNINQGQINLVGHKQTVGTICWMDGTNGYPSQLISGSSDKSIILWDAQQQEAASTIPAHDYEINQIVCLNEKLFASCCSGGIINVWDTKIPKPIKRYNNHSPVTCMAALKPNKLISVGEDSKLKLWDLEKDKFFVYAQQNPINKIISTGDTTFATCRMQPPRVDLWNEDTLEFTHMMHDNIVNAMDCRNRVFGSAGAQSKKVHFWTPMGEQTWS